MNRPAPSGLIPVLATPFDSHGRLVADDLVRLTEFQFDAGADGVAIFGMASETFALDTAERLRILDLVSTLATGRRLVAGVSATGYPGALEQLRSMGGKGVTDAMVLPPHLVKPSASQLVDYFGGLAAEAAEMGIDVMVQDAPGATGVTQPVELLAQLSLLQGVTSIKVEAPPTVPKMAATRSRVAADVGLLGGQNAQFVLDEYSVGAQGTMPACEFTDVLRRVLDLRETEPDASESLYRELLPLIIWGLQSGYAWAVHKEVLVARGLITTAFVRAPGQALPSALRGRLAHILNTVAFPVLTGGMMAQ